MYKYIIRNDVTGESWEVSFEKKPTDEDLKEAASRLIDGEEEWTVGGAVSAAVESVTPGATSLGGNIWGFGGAVSRVAGEIFDSLGLDSLSNNAKELGRYLDEGAREAETAAAVETRRLEREYPQHEIARGVGQALPSVAVTLPVAAAARGAKLADSTMAWLTAGAAGAPSAMSELQAQRMNHLRKLTDGMDEDDAEMAAIGAAAPWALLSGATTSAATFAGGEVGKRLLGSRGLESIGHLGRTAGSRAAGARAASLSTGRFATEAPKLLSKGVGWGTARVGLHAGLEGVEEGVDEFLQAYIVQKMSRDPSITVEDAARRAVHAASVGALLGGALGSAGTKATREMMEEKAAVNSALIRDVLGASSDRLARKFKAELEAAAKKSPEKSNLEIAREVRARHLGEEVERPSEAFMRWLESGKKGNVGDPDQETGELANLIMEEGRPRVSTLTGSQAGTGIAPDNLVSQPVFKETNEDSIVPGVSFKDSWEGNGKEARQDVDRNLWVRDTAATPVSLLTGGVAKEGEVSGIWRRPKEGESKELAASWVLSSMNKLNTAVQEATGAATAIQRRHAGSRITEGLPKVRRSREEGIRDRLTSQEQAEILPTGAGMLGPKLPPRTEAEPQVADAMPVEPVVDVAPESKEMDAGVLSGGVTTRPDSTNQIYGISGGKRNLQTGAVPLSKQEAEGIKTPFGLLRGVAGGQPMTTAEPSTIESLPEKPRGRITIAKLNEFLNSIAPGLELKKDKDSYKFIDRTRKQRPSRLPAPIQKTRLGNDWDEWTRDLSEAATQWRAGSRVRTYPSPGDASGSKARRIQNQAKAIQKKVRNYIKNQGGKLSARMDMGILDLPPRLLDVALSVFISAIDAGISVSAALEKAYASLNRSDVNKAAFNQYIIFRSDQALTMMEGGSSSENALKATSVPLDGKTYPEIQKEIATRALSGTQEDPADISDFRSFFSRLRRAWDGASDITSSNGAFLGLNERMNAHVDYADRYSGLLSTMLLEPTADPNLSFLKTEGMWGSWMSKPTEEARIAQEEFEEYWKAAHLGRESEIDLSSLSRMGQQLIQGWKNVAELTGDMMAEEGVWVKYPDGKKRKFRKIGKMFWPRGLKPEYSKALSGLDASVKELNQTLEDIGIKLKNAGEIDTVSVESIKAWWDAFSGEKASAAGDSGPRYEGFLPSIDMARTARRIPPELMDFSLNAARRYIFNWAERFAQIKAFGQKARDGKDAFDIVEESLKKRNYTGEELRYLQSLRKAAYGAAENDLGWIEKRMMFLNKTATLTMLTGGFNAIRNLTGVGPTSAIYGYRNSVKALMQMRDYAASAKKARSWGVLRDDLALMLSGHDIALEGKGYIDQMDAGLTATTKRALRASGFSQAENFVRTHAALTSSMFVSEGVGAIKSLRDPALAEEFKKMSERLGVDWRKIVKEDNSRGEETSKFIRKAVKEVQGGYRYNQLPAWMSTPAGKFMFKFGAYGFQITRMIGRNAIRPAIKDGDIAPLLRLIAAAVGSGELLYFLREKIFGKSRPDATLKELLGGDSKAYNLFMRLLNDVTYAGTLGIVGDMAGLLKNVASQQRVKDPFDPAGMQIIENAGFFLAERLAEGTLLSPMEWGRGGREFLESQFSAYRYGRALASKIADSAGAEWDFSEIDKARSDRSFLRNATRRFNREVGGDMKNRIGAATYLNTPYTRYYESVKDNLTTGDARGAINAAKDFAEKLPEDERRGAWGRLSNSIQRSQPLKVGDSTSREIKEDFIRWAKRNLSEEDVARILRVQERYIETAENAGLIGSSPERVKSAMKSAMSGEASGSSLRKTRGTKRTRSLFESPKRKNVKPYGY